MSYPTSFFNLFIDSKTELDLQMKAMTLGDALFKKDGSLTHEQFKSIIHEVRQNLDDCLCSGHQHYLVKAQCFYFHFEQAIIFNLEHHRKNSIFSHYFYQEPYKRLDLGWKSIFLLAIREGVLPNDETVSIKEFYHKQGTPLYSTDSSIPSTFEEAKDISYFNIISDRLLIGLSGHNNQSTYFFQQPKQLEQTSEVFEFHQAMLTSTLGVFKEQKEFEHLLTENAHHTKTMKI